MFVSPICVVTSYCNSFFFFFWCLFPLVSASEFVQQDVGAVLTGVIWYLQEVCIHSLFGAVKQMCFRPRNQELGR